MNEGGDPAALSGLGAGEDLPDEAAVLAYLRADPEFLARHPQLLSHLLPPSRFPEGVIEDLQQHMVARLQKEIRTLKGSTRHLIATTRGNMTVQARTHEAVLALLDAGDFDGLGRWAAEDVPARLGVDIAVIAIEAKRPEQVLALSAGLRPLPPGTVDGLLGKGKAVMLRDNVRVSEIVYGGAASLVRSDAVVRLEAGTALGKGFGDGMLALGARERGAFHASQGTELLRFLAKVLERALAAAAASDPLFGPA